MDNNNVAFKYSDFFQDDGGLQKAKDDFVKMGDAIIEKAKQIKKEARFLNLDNLADLEKHEKKTQELIAANKNYQDSLKKIESLEKKLATAKSRTLKGLTKEGEALKKNRRELRQVLKIQSTQVGTVENLRAKLTLVTTAWTKLTQAELENTKRGRRLNASKKQLTTTLKQLEAKTNDNRRNVGNYSSALGGLRARFISVSQAAGVTLGIFGAFRLIRNSINIVKDYEKANATLAGVLNKSNGEIDELRTNSQELGATTVKTAQEVVELQTAYARLGFNQQEILDLTKPTIDGSIALNAGLAETATLVGAIVNSYDELSTTDAPQIMEVLAAATTNSALDFEKLNVALPIVLGAANALNVPLEEVTATLGKLSDGAIETSTGATSLRNIFIESAKRGINYKDALKQITESQDRLTTANEIFGKRAAVSALVIANNTEGVSDLTKKLEEANVVQRLVSNELDTLDGSLKLLRSAWEGYVLQLNDATGGGNALSTSIRFLAENLQTIFKFVGIGTATWLSYIAATKTANLITKSSIVWNKSAAISMNIKTIATQAATAAQRTFNTAVKANPLGLLLALLAAVVTAYYAFRDSATAAEKAQSAFNKSKKEGIKTTTEELSFESKIFKKRNDAFTQSINIRRAKGEDSKKLDKELLDFRQKLADEEIAINQKIIDDENRKSEKLKKELLDRYKFIDDNFKKASGSIKSGTGETTQQFERRVAQAKEKALLEFNEQNGKIEAIIETRTKNISRLGSIQNKIEEETTIKSIELSKKQQKAIQDRIKELALLRRRLEDLRNDSISNDEAREKKQTETKFRREIEAIKGNTKVEIELRKELLNTRNREIQEISNKYERIRFKSQKDVENLELQYIEDQTKKQIEAERIRREKVSKSILDNTILSLKEKGELIKKEELKSQAIVSKIILDGKLKELDDLEKINIAKIELSRKDFQTEEQFEIYKEQKIDQIRLNSLKKRLEYLLKYSNASKVEIAQIKGEIAEIENSFKKAKDPFQELGNAARNVVNQVFNQMDRLQRGSLQRIEENIDKQKEAIADQRALAEKGLTNTLAFEQKELAKREVERIKQQKRIERMEKVKALYSAYNGYAQNSKDPGKALVNTLRDFAILEGITASFRDGGITGIDGVKTNAKGITLGKKHNADGMGGNLAWHERGEGFLNKDEVSKMGHDNFYKMKKLASMGKIDKNFFSKQNQNFVSGVVVPQVSTDTRLVDEMREVKKAIIGRPVQNWDARKLVDGTLDLVETIIKPNSVKRNHYRVKKSKL